MKLFDGLKNPFNTEGDYPYEADPNDYGYSQQSDVQDYNQGGIGISSTSLELKVVKPDSFKNVTQIADHLLNKRTVVLNLESTNKETARRLIDFLSGVAYSIDGQMKRVANNTFVITPDNVDVSGEQIADQPGDAATGAKAADDDLYGSF
ncbi:MAG: cell division protein SepF [Ruminococcaceae bacterium]|nr:cell division protein SepF [Oscillospiraceae bacterium]